MKRSVALFVLFFFVISAQAQTAGQVVLTEQQLQKLPNDSSRIRPMFLVARSFLFSDSAKAIHYIKEGLALSRKYNQPKFICIYQVLWAEIYVSQGKFDPAIALLEDAHKLALRTHDNYIIVNYEELRGEICSKQGDYPGAIEHNIAYMRYGEEKKDTQYILVGLVNISEVYQSEKNDEKAGEYAHRILQYPYNTHNVIAVTKALEIIATADMRHGHYGPARDSLQRALRLYAADNNDNGKAIIYSVLARCYPADPLHQLQYALPAQDLWERLGPDNGYAVSNLVNLGAIYVYLARSATGQPANTPPTRDTTPPLTSDTLDGDETAAWRTLHETHKMSEGALKAKARAYYTLALDRANRTNDREGLILVSDSLAALDLTDNHFQEAATLLQRRNRLYDSVFSQENKNRLAGVEADYKVELSDKQLQINKLALSNQIKIKWLLISSLILVLLILGLIFRQTRVQKKNNASLSSLNTKLNEANGQLNEANRVKNQFFGILNHDLRSPVAGLISLLRLRQRDPDMIDQQSVEARTGQITLAAEELLETMEDLLVWSKGQMQQFRPKMKPVPIAHLFNDIEKKFAAEGATLHFDQPPGLSVTTDEDFAKTILRNLTGNAIKALHAHAVNSGATAPPAQINWKAYTEGSTVCLSITDNGPGATAEQLSPLFDESAPIGIRSGLGLHIVRDMAKAINCEVTTSAPSNGGLQVRLQFT